MQCKHSMNPKYMKQWILYHVKMYVLMEAFKYFFTQGQLNNEGGGELHKMKGSWDKTEIGKEIIR